MTEPEAARLSRLLFCTREEIVAWADIVKAHAGQTPTYLHQLVAEIDAYRAEHGWSPHGFGGESDEGEAKA